MSERSLNILLLGEFSGLHINLKQGFKDLGHKVTLVSSGDGYRGFKSDIVARYSSKPGVLGQLMNTLFYYRLFKKLSKEKYDVVQLVNHFTFSTSRCSAFWLQRFLLVQKKISLLSCGDDIFNYADEKFQLYYKNVKRYDNFNDFLFNDPQAKSFEISLIGNLKSINIACNHTYYFACLNYINSNHHCKINLVRKPILMPFDIQQVEFSENIRCGKIIFWHGLNRIGAKGTNIIEEAFKIISNRYPDIVECKIIGGMPYNDFKAFLQTVNVFVDQVFFTDGYGYSAISALASNKIVMSADGEQLEKLLNVGYKVPFVGIKPDVDFIVLQMEKVIHNIDYYLEISKNGRKFIEDYHKPKLIAEEYVEAWNCL